MACSERFFQVNPDRSGMGLGLFITKEIVDRHSGSISVDFRKRWNALHGLPPDMSGPRSEMVIDDDEGSARRSA